MTKRNEHLFQFAAHEIATAADAEAKYHAGRVDYWRTELESAVEVLKKTASADVRKVPVTGGSHYDVVLNYGDPTAYRRMQEAQTKIDRHREQFDRFESDARLYATQGANSYELDAVDVAHFRLNGRPREE